MAKGDDLSPTSDLKFAARHCDLPYLDFIKNHRSNTVEKAINQGGEESGPAIECAWSLVNSGDRLSKLEDLLFAVEAGLESAYRGDTSGPSPLTNFISAMSLLALCRELLELVLIDSDEALDRLCRGVTEQAIPQKKKTPKKNGGAA